MSDEPRADGEHDAALALGDALAMSAGGEGFSTGGFRQPSPRGQLGKKLLRVERYARR